MDEQTAWSLEERFWLEGAAAYGSLVDPECLMAFPGVGLMRVSDVLKSLHGAPRWAAVEMTERIIGRPGEAVLVLGYKAKGCREGAEPYVAFCTSTYRREQTWKLVQHQQTLAD